MSYSKKEQTPTPYLRHLQALKLKMGTATDFSEVYNYFFDHLGENPAFLDIGQPTRHEVLEQVLANIAGKILKTRRVAIQRALFIHLPEHGFIHGTCHLNNNHIATFFYFEDIDAGMMATSPMPPTGETQIARFSCHRLGHQRPSAN